MKIPIGLCIRSALCSVIFRLRGVKSSLVICDGRFPVLYTAGSLDIGYHLTVRSRIAPCEIGATEPGAQLKIGRGVFINQGASIPASHYIEIGDDTHIGDFAAILDTNWHGIDPAHPARSEPVVIGANVWLGRGVTVLPGGRIGDHSVVAAGSIVKGDIPPRVLAAGNPAKVVRELRNIPDGWCRQ
jgi:acetyltransferase-like isoleucine patch superfamily enzyme